MVDGELSSGLQGQKVLGIAKQAGITGDISKLETQLQVVWWHMTTQTPTGVANFIEQYKTVTDVRAATDLYEKKWKPPAYLTWRTATLPPS